MHWHGLNVISANQRTDVIQLLPAGMVTGDMVADNPGEWMFHCHVGDHMMGNQCILRNNPYLIKFQKKKSWHVHNIQSGPATHQLSKK